jgi:hypothetical protein
MTSTTKTTITTMATTSQAAGSPKKSTEKTAVDDGDNNAPYA